MELLALKNITRNINLHNKATNYKQDMVHIVYLAV